jgi:FkbM family methyltransferase
MQLTNRYFGRRAALRYLMRLPKAIQSDAMIQAFLGGNYRSHLDGLEIKWIAPNPQFMEEIIEMRCYTPNQFFEIGRNDIVLDLGANVGTFTLWAALKAVDGLVVAVEPNPSLFEMLKQNVAVNGINNVILLNALVSDKDGQSKFYMLDSGGSVREGYSTKGKEVELTSYRISSIMSKYGIQSVDFVKMDVEGAEFDIFQGDMAFLQHVSRLAMEVHPACGSVEDVLRLLNALGFTVDQRPAFPDSHLIYVYARRPPSAE